MCILCILVHPATDCGFAMASRQRGLILQKKHAFKFFDASETKTLELRNHNLRCVAPREHFWIVECGHGRNTKGNLAYRVLGRVTFVENVALTAASVASMYSHHLCSQADFKELQSKWKKPDNIIGWRVTDAHVFRPSRWLRPSSNEGWLHFRLEDLYIDFEMSDCDRGEAAILSQLQPILPERTQPMITALLQNCARPLPSNEVAEVSDVAAIAGVTATAQEEDSRTSASASRDLSPAPHRMRVIDITEERGAYSPVPEATAENIAGMLDEIDDALKVKPRSATDTHETETRDPAAGATGASKASCSLGATAAAEAPADNGSDATKPADASVTTGPEELDPETEKFFLSELEAQLGDAPPSPAVTGAENASSRGAPTTTSAAFQSDAPSTSSPTDNLARHSRPSTDTTSTPDVWKAIRDARYSIQRRAGRAVR